MIEIEPQYQQDVILVQVPPPKIDLFNKIIEAYGHLALVSTIDAQQGILAVWVTPDTRQTTEKLLTKMPLSCRVLAAPGSEDSSN